jgi:hypothetical protein
MSIFKGDWGYLLNSNEKRTSRVTGSCRYDKEAKLALSTFLLLTYSAVEHPL